MSAGGAGGISCATAAAADRPNASIIIAENLIPISPHPVVFAGTASGWQV